MASFYLNHLPKRTPATQTRHMHIIFILCAPRKPRTDTHAADTGAQHTHAHKCRCKHTTCTPHPSHTHDTRAHDPLAHRTVHPHSHHTVNPDTHHPQPPPAHREPGLALTQDVDAEVKGLRTRTAMRLTFNLRVTVSVPNLEIPTHAVWTQPQLLPERILPKFWMRITITESQRLGVPNQKSRAS